MSQNANNTYAGPAVPSVAIESSLKVEDPNAVYDSSIAVLKIARGVPI